MTDNSEESQLVYICEQLQLCMLPALKEDLDEVQLLPEHFQNYNSVLRQELPKLYDVLQQIENIILQDAAQLKLRTQLVLLLCELTATPTVYKLSADAEAELDNANRLLQKVSVGCHSAEATHIFSYYEQHLQGNCWKRQLGATHGYVRYLEYCCTGDARFPAKLITFSLAVGLNFRECYQLEYKQLGVRIFQILLQHGLVIFKS
ncbi:uncharacterized protein LOC108603922 isoform X2 [Drosophila busckii]|uniref:uncharacterized protein LOC108603922 isoform X2 n=1 Tax=Drosophila busckii TaxID=30019 RepID=UPI00083ED9D2|nr:uncharacterized protein LOC108603922 isoform X2 [Drosophila busckii]